MKPKKLSLHRETLLCLDESMAALAAAGGVATAVLPQLRGGGAAPAACGPTLAASCAVHCTVTCASCVASCAGSCAASCGPAITCRACPQ